jgi:hypothetical protein
MRTLMSSSATRITNRNTFASASLRPITPSARRRCGGGQPQIGRDAQAALVQQTITSGTSRAKLGVRARFFSLNRLVIAALQVEHASEQDEADADQGRGEHHLDLVPPARCAITKARISQALKP